MEEQLDMAVLLARFKLLVRRQLAETVDLDLLTRDAEYARSRLSAIEETAENEDLLVMLLKVRERVLPPHPAAGPAPVPAAAAAPKTESLRSYKFGARGW